MMYVSCKTVNFKNVQSFKIHEVNLTLLIVYVHLHGHRTHSLQWGTETVLPKTILKNLWFSLIPLSFIHSSSTCSHGTIHERVFYFS